MPLLPLEPFLFPEDLFAQPAPAEGSAACWWVLHTRPRAEKALARKFIRRGTAFFLPLYQKQWRSRGRLMASHMPLFPGYVFLFGDGQARHQALETNAVARVLPVVNQQQLHDDLAAVHRLMISGVSLAPEDRIEPGARVEITNGPFSGMEGVVLRRGGQRKFIIEVRLLQRGVSVELESWTVQPVGRVSAVAGTSGP